MRLVLDKNVLIAALVADGLCRDLVRRRLEGHCLISSQPLLEELSDKLEEKFRVRAKDIPFLRAYTERVELVRPASLPKDACRDPDDVTVLATSVAGKADCIITGDEDLLVLQEYNGIQILTPRQWLETQDKAS
ncbi:MAG: putative toxin-antitoxin system toxin component, PIN family [Chthoniobacterales bacterium]